MINKVEIIESWYQIAEKTDTFLSPFVRELVLDKGIALREINIAAADTALEILNRLRRDETFNTSRLAASVQLLGDIYISLSILAQSNLIIQHPS